MPKDETPTKLGAALIRRGFKSELRSARDNFRRAMEGVRSAAEAIEVRDAGGLSPLLSDLRRLVADATDAYQWASALHALDRVAFMLPDETEEG